MQKPALIVTSILLAALSGCQQKNDTASSTSDLGASNEQLAIHALTAPTPVDGSSLITGEVTLGSAAIGDVSALKLSAAGDARAEYFEFYACPQGGDSSLCLPSPERPGVFTLNSHVFPAAPAGLLEVGVRACVTPSNAVDPLRHCGAWVTQPYSQPANTNPELQDLLRAQYRQEITIKSLANELTAEFRAYQSADAKMAAQATDPTAYRAKTLDFMALVSNKLLVGEHLLGESLLTQLPYDLFVLFSESDEVLGEELPAEEEAGLQLIEAPARPARPSKSRVAALLALNDPLQKVLSDADVLNDAAQAQAGTQNRNLPQAIEGERQAIKETIASLPKAQASAGAAVQEAMEDMLRKNAMLGQLLKEQPTFSGSGKKARDDYNTRMQEFKKRFGQAQADVAQARKTFNDKVAVIAGPKAMPSTTVASKTSAATAAIGEAPPLPPRPLKVGAAGASGQVGGPGKARSSGKLVAGALVTTAVAGAIAGVAIGYGLTADANASPAGTLATKLDAIFERLVHEKRKLVDIDLQIKTALDR